MTHKNHQPRKLSRLSDISWSLDLLTTKDGPYLNLDDSDTTMYLEKSGQYPYRMTQNLSEPKNTTQIYILELQLQQSLI
jgi:hypothetical protein